MLALACQLGLHVLQCLARMDHLVKLLARRIVGLAPSLVEGLGEPCNHLGIDRVVLGQPPSRLSGSCEPASDRRSEPRSWRHAAPWPTRARSRRLPPSPPDRPCSGAATRPTHAGLPPCLQTCASTTANECKHPPCL